MEKYEVKYLLLEGFNIFEGKLYKVYSRKCLLSKVIYLIKISSEMAFQ